MGEGRSIWADCFYGLAVLLWTIGGLWCLWNLSGIASNLALANRMTIFMQNIDPDTEVVTALWAQMKLVEYVLHGIDHGIDLVAALLVHVLGFLSFFAARSVDPKAGLGAKRRDAIAAF